jgi:hypothetical protein
VQVAAGAVVAVVIALMSWMAASVNTVATKVNRIDVALFGEQGVGGFGKRLDALEQKQATDTPSCARRSTATATA